MNDNENTERERLLRDKRAASVQELYAAARRIITQLNEQIMAQHRYIQELEKQRRIITQLKEQIMAQHRYIQELEKQLEPSVIAEIRDELSAEKEAHPE